MPSVKNYVKEAERIYQKSYKTLFDKKLKENLEQLNTVLDNYIEDENYQDKWFEDKLDKFFNRFRTILKETGIDSVQKIKDTLVYDRNLWLMLYFLKDPTRQNIGEDVLKDMLDEQLSFGTIKKIDYVGRGRNGFYAHTCNGEFTLSIGKPTETDVTAKSIDFIGETHDNRMIYICHKRTTGVGGAQDSASTDADISAKCFEKLNRKDGIAIIVLDGPYYDDARKIIEKRIRHPYCVFTKTSHIGEVFEAINRGEI